MTLRPVATLQGDDRDLKAMGGCKINICMGRDAGAQPPARPVKRGDFGYSQTNSRSHNNVILF